MTYDNIAPNWPNHWTLNKKTRNILIEHLGNDTMKWIGVIIPIETAPTEKGRAIYVDENELKKVQTRLN